MKNKIIIILVSGFCILTACKQNQSNKSITEQQSSKLETDEPTDQELMDFKIAVKNHKIVKVAFNNWVGGNGNFFDLLDEDVIWRVTGRAPYSGTYNSKQEFMDKAVVPINVFLSTKITPKLIDINASKDIVWLQWKGKADAVDKSQYINEYAWKLKFNEEGKIIVVDAFLDTYILNKLVEK